jgi:hypothetical protein
LGTGRTRRGYPCPKRFALGPFLLPLASHLPAGQAAGSGTDAAAMFLSIIPAVLYIKTTLAAFTRWILHTLDGAHRAGVEEHMALAARFVGDRAHLKWGIRHDYDKPHPWPEAFGYEQSTLADLSHPCQVDGKFVR